MTNELHPPVGVDIYSLCDWWMLKAKEFAGNLTLAEDGLASATQEIAQLRAAQAHMYAEGKRFEGLWGNAAAKIERLRTALEEIANQHNLILHVDLPTSLSRRAQWALDGKRNCSASLEPPAYMDGLNLPTGDRVTQRIGLPRAYMERLASEPTVQHITERDYTDAAMHAGLPPPTQRDMQAMNAVIDALYENRTLARSPRRIEPSEVRSREDEAFRLLNAATYYVPRDRELHADMLAWMNGKPKRHTTEDDFRHFLSYEKLSGQPPAELHRLRKAYYAGADVGPPIAARCCGHEWYEGQCIHCGEDAPKQHHVTGHTVKSPTACAYIGAPQGEPSPCVVPAGHPPPHKHAEKSGGSLSTPQGEPALTQTDGLPGTREPIVIEPSGNAGESPALTPHPGCNACGSTEREKYDPRFVKHRDWCPCLARNH